ncbi:MAG TPA: sulfatase-like hydrolase/transferase [Phycisphaerae bacterium]|nr:sulfatase-like hydrolase/transferase [Phycisphaerae bacterium]
MARSADRPNILLIVTDHQAFFAHDRPGEFDYRPPRFERFCAEGVRFDRAYCVTPLCTPARASLMTGVYPSTHGLIRNTDYHVMHDFRQGQRLYSHYLSETGYRNAYVGKWHCGRERLPADYGIEGWSLPDYGKVYMSQAYRAYAGRGGLGEARARIEHGVNRPELEGTAPLLHHESPWYFMNASGVLTGPPAAHEEQFVAHLASEKLRELTARDQPWSLVASFWGPHQPFFPTEPYASMVDPTSIPEYPTFRDDLTGRPLRHVFHRDFSHPGAKRWRDWSTWQEILARAYGQGYQLDAAVGEILDALDASGQADRTLVVWVADHGDAVASHGGLWDKGSTFTEEVARVPMAIRLPGRAGAGARVDAPVSNMDVTATMLAAAGLDVPATMHSRSLLGLCRGGEADWPEHIICEHHGHGIVHLPQRIAVTRRHKYVACLYDGDELYDLTEDPYEQHNLINSPAHADVRADLRRRIVEHLAGSDDPEAARLAHSLRMGY